MRSSKLLFLIFLVLYFVVGLSLLITGSVAHRHATKFSNITGYSLMSSAGFIIALGVIIIVLSAIGLVGTLKNRVGFLQFFIGSLLIILVLEFIAAIIAFTLRNKAKSQLHTKLLTSLEHYKSDDQSIITEWNLLQQTWSCCGVDKANDWIEYAKVDEPPISCCIENNCTKSSVNASVYFEHGCYESARHFFVKYSKELGVVSILFVFVELAGLILAVFGLRDLRNNYGAV